MNYFLKLVGLTTQPLPEIWWKERPELVTAIFFGRQPSSIKVDDILVYYAVGGSKRICGVAIVTSKATSQFAPPAGMSAALRTKFRWKMDVRLLAKCANDSDAPEFADFHSSRVGQKREEGHSTFLKTRG